MHISFIDVVILSVILALVVIAIRSIMRSKGSCGDCASAGVCSAAHGKGTCPAASAAISDAQARLAQAEKKSNSSQDNSL